MNTNTTLVNPLLNMKLPVPFEAIEAEHVEPAVHELIGQMTKRIKEIGSTNTPHTYRDVLLILDRATEPLDFAMAVVRHLESVATTPAFRVAHNNVQGPTSAFYSSIPLQEDLWAAIKAVNAGDDAKHLTGVH